jgi:hypothetical protein
MIPDVDVDELDAEVTKVASAHNDLLEATDNLNQLADWCESNFEDPVVVKDRPVTLDNASKSRLYNFFPQKCLGMLGECLGDAWGMLRGCLGNDWGCLGNAWGMLGDAWGCLGDA